MPDDFTIRVPLLHEGHTIPPPLEFSGPEALAVEYTNLYDLAWLLDRARDNVAIAFTPISRQTLERAVTLYAAAIRDEIQSTVPAYEQLAAALEAQRAARRRPATPTDEEPPA